VLQKLVILAIVLLLWCKKIPELMKGLGSGIKEFKTLLKTVSQLIKKEEQKKGFS
jgi:Sec-independent protein translocase protein TatA